MTNAEEVKALWRSLPLAEENNLEQMDRQIESSPQVWQCVAQFLKEANLDTLPPGRNEIGEGAFCNVQEYETRLQSKYELHRRYIDVQLLTRGEELVWMAPKESALEPQGQFDQEADFILFQTARQATAVKVTPHSWLILFPTDAHMPCMAIDGKSREVRKIVVKIPVA